MTEKPYFLIHSVQKALRVLEILCLEGQMGISKLGKITNINKANVHRLVATLEYLGYVIKNPENSYYRPTLKTFELGSAILSKKPGNLRAIVHPFLEELGRRFHETNNLGLLEKGEVIYIDKVESLESLRMGLKIGSRVPAYCTALGKVLLSYFSETELEEYFKSHQIVKRTANTITSRIALRKNLREITINGYAIDNQEYSEGIVCIAAPLFNYTGKPIAAISIAGPSIRMNKSKLTLLQKPLLATAQSISNALGYPKQN